MARKARLVAAGVPHHVTQRGWAEIPRREIEADALRAATYAGLPYGEPDFIERLEQQAQRSLRRGTPGPKPKARAKGAGAN